MARCSTLFRVALSLVVTLLPATLPYHIHIMTQTPVISPDPARSLKQVRSDAMRFYYLGAAVLFLTLSFLGFSDFYLRGQSYPDREIPSPIRTIVIVHGISMTLWVLLITLQPALVVTKRLRWHMALGKAGAVLAVAILISGIMLSIRSAAIAPPDMVIWSLLPKPFMAVPFISVLIFTAFVALGIWYRKKPAIHRSMMMLATLAALSAAVSRIDMLNNLYLGTVFDRIFGPFFITLCIGVVLLGVQTLLKRQLDRVFAIGLAVLIASNAGILVLARTAVWEQFASLLVP